MALIPAVNCWAIIIRPLARTYPRAPSPTHHFGKESIAGSLKRAEALCYAATCRSQIRTARLSLLSPLEEDKVRVREA
jgi:hypothetical protein